MQNWHPEDTICALSTPTGTGALGIVRLSGKEAVAIANAVFSKDISRAKGYSVHFGNLEKQGKILDEVLINIFRAPRSFTGEDTVEITCHGSSYILQQALEVLIAQGARLAGPGEFSQRAFFNGKMDLTQTEAVADLIASESAAAHQMAIQQMKGGFSEDIALFKEKLVHFASLIELELDFSEEDVEFADRDDLKKLVEDLQKAITKLVNSFAVGNAIKTGVPVAIVGAPNSGKSTLLNALLNENKAIVSSIAGTTRDVIEDKMILDGVLYRFIDTAGIRETKNEIEYIGIQRALEKAQSAAYILLMVDAQRSQEEIDKEIAEIKGQINVENAQYLIVGNKADLVMPEQLERRFASHNPVRFISALNRQNLEDLEGWLKTKSTEGVHLGEQTVVNNVRHHIALKQTLVSLNEVLEGLGNNITGDFLAIDIRKALHHLGEITGEITTDDLLGNIFSKFCIGK